MPITGDLSTVRCLNELQCTGDGEATACGPSGGATPRLGVAWTDEGAGKGVGAELDPAMAALVMASHDGNFTQEDHDDASPRLAGKLLLLHRLSVFVTLLISQSLLLPEFHPVSFAVLDASHMSSYTICNLDHVL